MDTPAPGYFYTSSLSIARMQLLVSGRGRSPKVILRNAAACDMIALRYTCIKSVDGATGVCVIRELPTEREAIVQFLTRLPIHNIVWCGEGLPGLMQKVIPSLFFSQVCSFSGLGTVAPSSFWFKEIDWVVANKARSKNVLILIKFIIILN